MSTRFLMTTMATVTLAACAGLQPADYGRRAEMAVQGSPVPAQWMSPLPHGGSVAALADFWQQWRDPLLVELVAAAQKDSATIAQAASRLAQARATRVSSGSALAPSLDATASLQRGVQSPQASPATSAQLGLQAAWEIDVFGGNAAARDAAQARLDGAQANWHDARVSVAAEVAATYLNHRFCRGQLDLALADDASRAETARLTQLTAKAGFTAPATAQLASASAAESRQRLTDQRAQCDSLIKQLVALSAMPESDLRSKIQQNQAPAPDMQTLAAMFGIAQLPAEVITQRPDVRNAEREVLAAAAEVTSAQAQRLPRISLGGFIGAGRTWGGGMSSGGATSEGAVWTLGPLSITLPLFDAGRRTANVDASQARFDEAGANYRAAVRRAVREVEEALISLQSTANRFGDASAAASGYRANFLATQQRQRAGLSSLVELEDARRTATQADTALLNLQRDRIAAWISLYRAAGGGFVPL